MIGGNERKKHESKGLEADRGTVGKIVVIGAKERGGRVAAKPIPATEAKPIPATEAKTLGEFVAETVEPGSTVWTDATSTSGNLREYNCDAVNHSAGEYVRGSIRTNGIEGFWSLFKHGYCGIYHGMTVKHLHLYLTECTGRAGIRNTDILDQTTHKARPVDGKMLLQ